MSVQVSKNRFFSNLYLIAIICYHKYNLDKKNIFMESIMSTSVDGNFSARNSGKVWGKDLNETNCVGPSATYKPIEKAGINSSGTQMYVPEAISSLDELYEAGFSEQERSFFEPYTDVDKFEQSLKEVLSGTTSLLYEVSTTPPTSTADMSAQINKHLVNVNVSFGEVLTILVELLENMSNLCPEFKSIIDSLHKIGDDRMHMSKLITFIKQTIIDLQNKMIQKQQQKAREEAAQSAEWSIVGAGLGAIIAAVTLIGVIASGGTLLTLLPAVIGAISAVYSLANAVAKYEWLQDNANNRTDGHAEELDGGILTAMFGWSPSTIHKIEDVAAIIQVVLSLSNAATSSVNMVSSVSLGVKGFISGGRAAWCTFTNLVTMIIGALSAAQDVYCKVKEAQGDQKGAEEGFLFEGINDSGDTPVGCGISWLMIKMFDLVGTTVVDPVSKVLPGIGEDNDTVFSGKESESVVAKRQMAKMVLGIVGNISSQFGSTLSWDSKWDKMKEIEDLVSIRKGFEQMSSSVSKWTILVQLVEITRQLNQAEFQKYENEVNVSLKQLDARSTYVQGTQNASETVLANLLKIYQEYMKILGKTQEDLNATIKRSVDSFTTGTTRGYNALVK
jgi:hypothetical protein